MKPEKFMTFLMNEKNASLERTGKLAADNRKDEANQCKIAMSLTLAKSRSHNLL